MAPSASTGVVLRSSRNPERRLVFESLPYLPIAHLLQLLDGSRLWEETDALGTAGVGYLHRDCVRLLRCTEYEPAHREHAVTYPVEAGGLSFISLGRHNAPVYR
jgi:hypothetical protein